MGVCMVSTNEHRYLYFADVAYSLLSIIFSWELLQMRSQETNDFLRFANRTSHMIGHDEHVHKLVTLHHATKRPFGNI